MCRWHQRRLRTAGRRDQPATQRARRTVTLMTALPGAGHASAHIIATRNERGRKLSITNFLVRLPTVFQSTMATQHSVCRCGENELQAALAAVKAAQAWLSTDAVDDRG